MPNAPTRCRRSSTKGPARIARLGDPLGGYTPEELKAFVAPLRNDERTVPELLADIKCGWTPQELDQFVTTFRDVATARAMVNENERR